MTVRRDRMMAALILMYSRANGEGLWVCSLELWAVQTLRSKCPPSVSFADISPSGGDEFSYRRLEIPWQLETGSCQS